MTTLMVIVWTLLFACLVVVTAVRPHRTRHSRFELKRLGDEKILRRERLLGGVKSLLGFVFDVLVVIITALSIYLWQGWGPVFTVILLLCVMVLARQSFTSRYVMRLYAVKEPWLLDFVERFLALRYLSGHQDNYSDQGIESPEHFVHLVESADHILTGEQKILIKRGLSWPSMEVLSVMTPVDEIISVAHSDLLGPLVLDDLHKSGHWRFPVTKGDIDKVIGLINIAELLEVDAARKSPTAERAMVSLDVRLHSDTLLPEALRQLMQHPSQLGLVVDKNGKTVGVISLGDVIGALVGKNRGKMVQ